MAFDKNNYVKFIRGTKAAFDTTTKDPNTLYFITDVIDGESKIQLYLGNQLIGDESLNAESVDGKSLEINESKILQLKDFGQHYYAYNSETGEYSSEVVNGFTTGLQPRVTMENGEFVIGWYQPNTKEAADLSTAVDAINDKLDGIDSTVVSTIDTKISTAIAGLDHLSYTIVDSIDDIEDKIEADATDAVKYIYLIADSDGTNDKYDEYMVIKHIVKGNEGEEDKTEYSVEKIGNLDLDLSDYYTKTEAESAFATNTRVGTLETLLGAVKNDDNETISLDVVTQVVSLKALLDYVPADNSTETPAYLKSVKKLDVIATALGVNESGTGNFVIEASPVGNL